MEFSIREGCLKDIPRIIEVEIDAGKRFDSKLCEHLALPEDVSPEMELRRAADDGLLFVAATAASAPSPDHMDQKEDIVGFVYGTLLDDKRTIFIEEVSVAQHAAGHKLGIKLLNAVGDACRERKSCDRMALTTFIDVPWNMPYYERLGFREVTKNEDGELYELMQKKLQEEVKRGFDLSQRIAMSNRLPLIEIAEQS